MLQENTLYTDQTSKDALLKDKTAIANAFFINFLGTLGLFSISSTRGLMRSYMTDDAKMQVANIGDANKDISLSLKLYHDIGGIKPDTVNKMTRLLLKMKQKSITNKNLDEALVRELVAETLYVAHRPHPVIYGVVDAFVKKQASLKQASKAMFNAVKARKKELLPVSQEFYGIARQYALYFGDIPDIGSVPTPAPQVTVAGNTSPAVIDPLVVKHQAVVSNGPAAPVLPSIKTMVDAEFYKLLMLAKERKEYLRLLKDRGTDETELATKSTEIYKLLFNDLATAEASFSTIADLEGFLAGFGAFLSRQNATVMMPAMAIAYFIEKADTLGRILSTLNTNFKYIKIASKTYTYSYATYSAIFNKIITKVDRVLTNKVKAAATFSEIVEIFKERDVADNALRQVFPRMTQSFLFVGTSWFEGITNALKLTEADQLKIAFSSYFIDSNSNARSKIDNILLASFTNQYEEVAIDSYSKALYIHQYDNFFPNSKNILEDLQKTYHSRRGIVLGRFNPTNIVFETLTNDYPSVSVLLKNATQMPAMEVELKAKMSEYSKKSSISHRLYTANKLVNLAVRDIPRTTPENIFLRKVLAAIVYEMTEMVEQDLTTNGYQPREVFEIISKYKDSFNNASKVRAILDRIVVRYVADYGMKFVTEMTEKIINEGGYYRAELFRKIMTLAGVAGISHQDLGKMLLSVPGGKTEYPSILFKLYPDCFDSLSNGEWIGVIKVSQSAYGPSTAPKMLEAGFSFRAPSLTEDEANLLFAEALEIVRISRGILKEIGEVSKTFSAIFNMLPKIKKDEVAQKLKDGVFQDSYGARRLSSFENVMILKELLPQEEFSEYMSSFSVQDKVTMVRAYPVKALQVLSEADALAALGTTKLMVSNDSSVIEALIKVYGHSKEAMQLAHKASSDAMIPSYYKPAQRREYEHIHYRAFEKLSAISPADGELAFKQMPLNRRKGLIGYLVNERFMEESLQEVLGDSVPIKPLGNVSEDRLVQILKYNDIQTPRRPVVKEHTTYGDLMKQDLKAPPIKKLHVDKIDADADALERMSIEYDKKNRYAHGEIALLIEEAFNVSVPIQEEGHAAWLKMMESERQDPRMMTGVFHGTGSIGASMILRYGFKVIKANDPSVVGRMLGDGIYFSNVLDKVAQYIGDEGYSRREGTVGYIFEMTVSCGKHRRDFRCAGTGWREDERSTISPEWAVFSPNSQCKIYKAFKVKLITKTAMDELKKKHASDGKETEQVTESKFTSFSKFINEGEANMKHCLTYVFMDGTIPISETESVDFKDLESVISLSKNVKLDWTGMGPSVSIFNNSTSNTKIVRYTNEFQKAAVYQDDLRKFLKRLKQK